MTTNETLTEIARLVATLPGVSGRNWRPDLYLFVDDERVSEYGPVRSVECDGHRWSAAHLKSGALQVYVSGPHRRLVEGTATEATTNEGSAP